MFGLCFVVVVVVVYSYFPLFFHNEWHLGIDVDIHVLYVWMMNCVNNLCRYTIVAAVDCPLSCGRKETHVVCTLHCLNIWFGYFIHSLRCYLLFFIIIFFFVMDNWLLKYFLGIYYVGLFMFMYVIKVVYKNLKDMKL